MQVSFLLDFEIDSIEPTAFELQGAIERVLRKRFIDNPNIVFTITEYPNGISPGIDYGDLPDELLHGIEDKPFKKLCPICGGETLPRKGIHFDHEWRCSKCDWVGEIE